MMMMMMMRSVGYMRHVEKFDAVKINRRQNAIHRHVVRGQCCCFWHASLLSVCVCVPRYIHVAYEHINYICNACDYRVRGALICRDLLPLKNHQRNGE